MDLLARRLAASDRLARTRAAHIRGRLDAAATVLAERGAQRAWLFGSLASGGRPHTESDVDLAVEGLPAERLMHTILELEDLLGSDVDLVRMEEASESVRARVTHEGEELDVRR